MGILVAQGCWFLNWTQCGQKVGHRILKIGAKSKAPAGDSVGTFAYPCLQ